MHVLRGFVRYAMTEGLLFVYGTLQRGEEAHFKMKDAEFMGETQTAPLYRYLSVEDFHGMLKGGKQTVHGELYRVTMSKLRELDDWEYEVFRREIVELQDGTLADAYIFNRSCAEE